MNTFLQNIWNDIHKSNRVEPAVSGQVFNDLMARYAEKHRHYHTVAHLVQLFETVLAHREAVQNFEAMAMAIFFHDAIYDTYRKDNEAQSALLAAKMMPVLGHSPSTTQWVCEAIQTTQNHQAPVNANADLHLLLDADLAILGSPPDRYRNYDAAIRREYSWVPYFLYRQKRRQALLQLAARQPLYYTPFMQELYEEQARKNLNSV